MKKLQINVPSELKKLLTPNTSNRVQEHNGLNEYQQNVLYTLLINLLQKIIPMIITGTDIDSDNVELDLQSKLTTFLDTNNLTDFSKDSFYIPPIVKENKVLYSRKSNKKQSKASLKYILEEAEKIGCYAFVAPDSSGFKDVAILRCLFFVLEHDIKHITIISGTRSAAGTLTRSTDVAQAITEWFLLHIHDKITIDLDLKFLHLMVQFEQDAWVRNANTKLTDKTRYFYEKAVLNKVSTDTLKLITAFAKRNKRTMDDINRELNAYIAMNGYQLDNVNRYLTMALDNDDDYEVEEFY